MQHINVVISLNTWHCFLCLYVLKQWNITLWYMMVVYDGGIYHITYVVCDDTECSGFLSPVLCVEAHAYTHTPPSNGTCTVKVFH